MPKITAVEVSYVESPTLPGSETHYEREFRSSGRSSGGRAAAHSTDRLDALFERAEEAQITLPTSRVIIFSDHQRGIRDGADRFLLAEPAYDAALGYYLEGDYHLVLLGDVERPPSSDPARVMASYRETLALEAEFHREGRLTRLVGEQDAMWNDRGILRRHLEPLFPDIQICQALRWRVVDDGTNLGSLLLLHGHQILEGGTSLRRARARPAHDYALRARHDREAFNWARQRQLILIAAHTRRPVFGRFVPRPPKMDPDTLLTELRDVVAAGKDDLVPGKRAELEYARAVTRARSDLDSVVGVEPPCYFNPGCCSFPDGLITGIEIAGGRIRLVQWLDDEDRPRPLLLAEMPLTEAIAASSAP